MSDFTNNQEENEVVVTQDVGQNNGKGDVKTVRDICIERLIHNPETDVLTINHEMDKKDEENTDSTNVFDHATDGVYVQSVKRLKTIEERLAEQHIAQDTDNQDGNEVPDDLSSIEPNRDASTDCYEFNGELFETAAAKVSNQVVNDQKYVDQTYFQIRMYVNVSRVEGSVLSIKNPLLVKESNLLSNREKLKEDDVNKVIVRKINPFNFEISVCIPSKDGSLGVNNLDQLNNLILQVNFILGTVLKKTMEQHESMNIDAETLAKMTLALNNKNVIKTRFTEHINQQTDLDLDAVQTAKKVNEMTKELWEVMGVRPITDWKLNIGIRINKIHRSSDTTMFTTKRKDVRILTSEDEAMKIQPIKASIERSVPYLISDESEIANLLTPLEKNMVEWAENEARMNLGYKPLEFKHRKVSPEGAPGPDDKILDVLGIEPSEQIKLSNTVQALIEDQIMSMYDVEMVERAEAILEKRTFEGGV